MIKLTKVLSCLLYYLTQVIMLKNIKKITVLDFKLKSIFIIISSVFLIYCQRDNKEIIIYRPVSENLYYRNIFLENGKYYFVNNKDSTSIKILPNKIIAYNDIELHPVKFQKKYDFDLIESSNYQHGNFYKEYNFIYDIKIQENILLVKIVSPKIYANNYSIKLSDQELNLLKSTIGSFLSCETDLDYKERFTISINFIHGSKSNYFVKDMVSSEVAFFYDSVMFILIKHIIYDKNYEIIKDSINVSTSKDYEHLRYPPPTPPNER